MTHAPSSKVHRQTVLLYLFVLHIPLGVLMYGSTELGVVHQIAVVMLGLYWAVQREVPIVRTAYVVAYLIGVEVLWRMTESSIYWEFGKYGAVAVMIVALARRGLFRIPGFPLLYLALLLPACVVTLTTYPWKDSSNRLSFNLSGPLCLFVSCWFFSRINLSEIELKKLLLYLAVPLMSVAVATLFFTVTNPNLQFTNESNHATSGGFGPNQVSSMLGLGVFITAALLVSFKFNGVVRILLGGLILFFAAQSVLTFSRGGIYAALGALAALAVFQARDFGQFLGRFLPIIAIAVIFLVLVFPSLNDFTGGKLEERFESSDTTSRLDIMEQELRTFIQNPAFGVGVGQVISERYFETHQAVTSHTEFTRVLSEHGLLGVLAIVFLLAACVQNVRRQPSRVGKALIAGCLVWAGLFMLNAGMRLAAPAFVWGLSFATMAESVRRTKRPLRRLKHIASRPIAAEANRSTSQPSSTEDTDS